MKKLISFLLIIICAVSLIIPCAAANRVNSIAIDTAIYSDGAATITQVWSGSFNEGTENYIPFRTNGYLTITDLTVYSGDTQYTTLDTWDIDATFNEKAGKCGLNRTDEGYEICWGISEYGYNTYTVSYTVESLAGAYTDSDGFNFRFVNDEMNTTPTDVKMVIRMADGTPLTDSNCNIWAFGYDGQIGFTENGTISAYTESPIDSSSHMTVMVEFAKGVLNPVRTSDQSFETVKERAFDGSDYETDSGIGSIILFFVVAIILAFVVFAIISSIVTKIKFNKFVKETPYYRDLPNEKSLNASYFIARSFNQCKEETIIGARLLRLVSNGCIESEASEHVGFMGRTKQEINLRLVKEPSEDDIFDTRLFNLLRAAAGDDGILQQKELEKYCSKNPEILRSIIDDSTKDGRNILTAGGAYKGAVYNKLKQLTDEGKTELSQLIGFKKYLLEFSLIAEREVSEIEIWQEYLIYAVLLGIADKVTEQLKEVYPSYIAEIEQYEYNAYYVYSYYHFMYASMINREREIQAERSAGSGGSASFGGGGGFSGGGSGGGSR